MKKLLFLFISLNLITSVFAQYTITDSLILYYPFNGNTNDWSGNGFDGLLNGATLTTDHNGNANSAYYFDGINDYIDLPNHSSLHPDFPFTIAAWIKPEYNAQNSQLNLLCTEYNTNYYTGAWLILNGQSQQLSAGTGNGGGIGSYSRYAKLSNQQLNYNTWYFVIGIYEAYNNKTLYINCLKASGYYTGLANTSVINTSCHGSIGRFYTGNPLTQWAKGTIDEVAIWNRALTDVEISELCRKDIWQVIQANTSEEELKFFNIYPNPIVNEAIINFNNPTQETHQIIIRNINGQQVQSYDNITSSSCIITKRNLVTGVYILELQNTVTKEQIIQKIIIQ